VSVLSSATFEHSSDRDVARTRRALAVCDLWYGSNGFAGVKALRRAEWDVVIVPEWDYVPSKWRTTGMRALARLIRPLAAREFNDELVRQAERWRPELLLVFKGTFVHARTIRRLREIGVRTYCFFPDVSFRAHGPWIAAALPEYDWVFTTKTFGLADMRDQLGVTRASLLRHAFDPEVHRPLPVTADDAQRFACDICFIGTWSEKKERVIAALRAARPNLRIRIWGEFWDRARAAELTDDVIGGHEVVGDQYARAIAGAKINLAILSEQRAGASDGDRITSRTFHIPAAGGFMLHERTDELLELFREGIECACFEGPDELARVADEYLADDRRRELVADRGHRLVWSRDSWDHRIREILARHESLAP
jgi:spore maturation protein CgeB